MRQMAKIVSKNVMLMSLIYLQACVFIALMVFFSANMSPEVYQAILVLIFFECVFLSFIGPVFNIYQLFLLMMFLFNVIQPIFEFFGWYTYPLNNLIMLGSSITVPIEDETLAETYKVLITMLMGTSVGWVVSLLVFSCGDKKETYESIRSVVLNRDLFKVLFLTTCFLSICYNFVLLYQSLEIGYVAAMHLQSMIGDVPLILRVSDLFYPVFGYMMLFMSKGRRNYALYSVLFLTPYMIQLFTGLRGEFVSVFLTIIFVYHHHYGFKEIKAIAVRGIFIFLLMSFMGIYRFSGSGGVTTVLDNVPVGTLLLNLMAINGSSMGVISYTIQLKDEFFNSVPFLLGYIPAIFSVAPNYTYTGLEHKDYLAQHITYLLFPEKLYGGSTIGTAMGAEFYEFSSGNFFIIFSLSALVLYVGGYCVTRLYKSKLMFYLGCLYIQVLIMSPRGSIMKVFNKETIIIGMVFLIVALLANVFSNRSNFKNPKNPKN